MWTLVWWQCCWSSFVNSDELELESFSIIITISNDGIFNHKDQTDKPTRPISFIIFFWYLLLDLVCKTGSDWDWNEWLGWVMSPGGPWVWYGQGLTGYDSLGHLAFIIMQQINMDEVMGFGNGQNMYQQIKGRHPPLITKLVGSKCWVNPKPGN